MTERFSRNEALFGTEGQAKIKRTAVAIVGLGGLGSHVAQQLAYLGVGRFTLIDDDHVTPSSMNRLIGAYDADVPAETPKVDVAERMIRLVQPEADVSTFDRQVEDAEATSAVARADVVFGCVDRDVHRLTLVELCSNHAKPYFDLATDVVVDGEKLVYGGRVVFANGRGCLVCLQELDQRQIGADRMNPAQREADQRIYGVDRGALAGTGPMVVSINGVVASLAVTEFICHATGLREPAQKLTYYADQGGVRRGADQPPADCYYCAGIWGSMA